MYKDWNDFETFLEEFKVCRNLKNFRFVVHKFNTFLAALIEEVGKRSGVRGVDVASLAGFADDGRGGAGETGEGGAE